MRKNLIPAPTCAVQPMHRVNASLQSGAWLSSGHSGNQTALRHVAAPRIQAKLEVGSVNDSLEAEADRVADHVMRMPDSGAAVGVSGVSSLGAIRRKCAECEKEDEEKMPNVQRKAEAGAGASGGLAPASVQRALSMGGRPLGVRARQFFEPRLGCDLSSVRIHTGAEAGASARDIGARAYTLGSHVVFSSRESEPEGEPQKPLLAHELAHVIQQESFSSAAFAAHSAGAPAQSQAVRRQPAGQPNEPLEVSLARQNLFDMIDELTGKLHEIRSAAKVDTAEREAKVAPVFVQEDPQVKSMQQQIASGRTQVPARLAKLNENLKAVGREALKESDNLDELRARIRFVEQMNSFIPALLPKTAQFEALLKEQKTGEEDYANTIAFFKEIQEEIERTKRFLPDRAAYLTQRSQYLQQQATSAASRAGVGPDTQVDISQLALLRTIIEASPTLKPYLTEQRAKGSQPTDLRNTQKFVIHSTDSELQTEAKACEQGDAGPGEKIGGFYCRKTDTIHLPPDAKFGAALHESIHKYSKLLLRGACSHSPDDTFLNEGLTQYFADIVLADQGLPKFTGHAYQNQLKCATRFINTFHVDEVATAYFLGVPGAGRLGQYLRDRNRPCPKFCAPEEGASD